ncbi:hypothetical protein Hypma_013772 [Hypsizygus marmoreus]|uniref:F-box domain-containing protein n=1 Tax=Hypsizygus marmoreus TaxID=39966 RepID=A0A369KAW7_HYPMA|nr:hypothetical protein Hypma_013772 [Hypsizygus marmoreus]
MLPNLHEFGAVCTIIAQTRPSILFPKLSTLKFNAYDVNEDLVHYLIFMTPDVINLEFKLSGRDVGQPELGSSMRLLFDRISSSMKNLRSLSITLIAINNISAHFINLLAKTLADLKSLERVILPPRAIVGKVIASLAGHPHLIEILPAYRGLSRESRSASNSPTFSPRLNGSSFRSLKVISFCSTPRGAGAFLADPCFPAGQVLRIHVQVLPSKQRDSERDPVGHILCAIQNKCTAIMDVSISETSTSDVDVTTLSFVSMRPMFHCIHLTTLTIWLRGCLPWTAADFNEFAAALPSAITLMLNEAPLPPLPTLQPISELEGTLSVFSRHCSQLRELGVCFNASRPRVIGGSSPFVAPRFKSLVVLHVGTSPISNKPQNIVAVTAFLLTILPEPCKITVGGKGDGRMTPSREDSGETDSDDESSVFGDTPFNHIQAWQRVQELRLLRQMESVRANAKV